MGHRCRFVVTGPVDLETLNHVCLADGNFSRVTITADMFRIGEIELILEVQEYLCDVHDLSEVTFQQALKNMKQMGFDVVIDETYCEAIEVNHSLWHPPTTYPSNPLISEFATSNPPESRSPAPTEPLLEKGGNFSEAQMMLIIVIGIFVLMMIFIALMMGR